MTWHSLPTSKMELFVTIGICKVIFCRLMMLCIQYCPVKVSSLLAPFCCRWFHLQTSEMVLFVTIAIPNIVFCWVMVSYAQFSSYELLAFLCQFVAESISFQVILP